MVFSCFQPSLEFFHLVDFKSNDKLKWILWNLPSLGLKAPAFHCTSPLSIESLPLPNSLLLGPVVHWDLGIWVVLLPASFKKTAFWSPSQVTLWRCWKMKWCIDHKYWIWIPAWQFLFMNSSLVCALVDRSANQAGCSSRLEACNACQWWLTRWNYHPASPVSTRHLSLNCYASGSTFAESPLPWNQAPGSNVPSLNCCTLFWFGAIPSIYSLTASPHCRQKKPHCSLWAMWAAGQRCFQELARWLGLFQPPEGFVEPGSSGNRHRPPERLTNCICALIINPSL